MRKKVWMGIRFSLFIIPLVLIWLLFVIIYIFAFGPDEARKYVDKTMGVESRTL